MPNLTQAMDAIERHIGLPKSRAVHIAHTLQDAGVIERGRPGAAPEITLEGFVELLLALASGGTLRNAAQKAAQLLEATPGGVSLKGAPVSIARLRSELLALAETALEFPDDLADLSIEVVATWPEVVIRHLGRTTRFVPIGADASHWQSAGHRAATIINGRAFRDAVRAIFKGR